MDLQDQAKAIERARAMTRRFIPEGDRICCHKCGQVVSRKDNYCQYCGVKLAVQESK